MQSSLLSDPERTVFAMNCRVEGSTLHCGALYLEPLIRHQSIRLADERATLSVDIPSELLNQSIPFRAWDVELPISHE
jgi:hypothetical protein